MTKTSSIVDGAVAVIGLGCRYPDAPTPLRLWENVLARRMAFRRLPNDRLHLPSYYDPDARTPDKTYGSKAATIDGFEFDWIGRRIPRSTLETTDVAHWLALDVALQALHDAGYGRATLPRERTGVVVGNTLTGEQSRSLSLRVRWPFVERALRAAAGHEGLPAAATEDLVSSTESHFKSVFPPVDEDTLAGSLSNTIAGRICNFLDLNGGGYTVDGACASSLLAVTTAANALCNDDLDVALVGGVDVSLDPFELVGFAKVGALSPTHMRVYDRAANGFIPGEGCGFVVLKRLCDARDDGDYVYATLRGWGVSSDGAGGITAPSVKGQALAIRRAYKRAGYSPALLHFVEGHGTGTPAGDPVELRAISSAMEAYGATRPRSCGVTSFKSIVGHTKAAAGIGGFIKAAIATNRRVVPPTAGCVDPNPAFDEAARVLYPIREGRVESPDVLIRAGVSAMGFGGINTHVTLESGDPPASRLRPSLPEETLLASVQETELFLMSADSVEALTLRVEEVAACADGLSVAELTDLAAKLSGEAAPDGRVRAAIVASDPEELGARLEEVLETLRRTPPVPGTARSSSAPETYSWLGNAPPRPRVGFLFPGQGSQQLGMAHWLVRRFDWAKHFVEEADRWLVELGREPISPLVFRPLDCALDGNQILEWRRILRETQHAQPAICLASALWLKYLARLGISPAVVGGHSLGELSAFHAAGGFDDRTLLELAATRGRLMADTKVRGAMASLSCSRKQAEALIAEAPRYCTIANLNAPERTVISGDPGAVDHVVEAAKRLSIAAVTLDVAGAFHSAHFREAALSLRESEAVPEVSDPLRTPVLSALDGREINTGVMVRDYLARQMCAEVDFVSMVRSMAGRCDLLLEVGPGRVLSGLVGRTVGGEGLRSFPLESRPAKDGDFNTAMAALYAHGLRLRLDALHEGRLCRPFVPSSERVFIRNPCERPFPEAIAPTKQQMGGERASVTHMPPPSPAAAAARESAPVYRDVAESGIIQKPNARAVVLAAVQAQTGFPVESLTLELRLVDDLHFDSIKTVELVSGVADQIGISEAFDAAQFADATLGELIERVELLEKQTAPGASGPLGRSETDPKEADGPVEPRVQHFCVEWTKKPLPSRTAPGGLLEGRTLLLTADPEDTLIARLSRELEHRGVDVRVCAPQDAFENLTPCDHLLVVASDRTESEQTDAVHEVVTLLTRATDAMPRAGATHDRTPCVAWIRARANDYDEEGSFDWSPDAFAATVHLEHRRLRVRSIEFASADRRAADVANEILAELADERAFGSARYDADGRRFVGEPHLQSRASYPRRQVSIGEDDVVVVTGGAKGITAQCALALARETKATMVLVGSSPAEADSAAAGAEEIRETLERFAAEGLRCDYRQCDMTVGQEVERLVAGVRNDFGSLNVVVHGAGLNQPRPVEEPGASEVLGEIGPKVIGALHLFNALDDAPPKMFVALTSVVGVIGMPNNAWYAFANQSLDRSLGQFARRHPSSSAVSLAYSIWQDVGMGAKLGSVDRLAKLGIDAISVEEGAAHFVELVTKDPGIREVIVTSRLKGVDTWQPVMPPLPRAHRFVDRVIALEPGSELTCRTTLTLERDPYVRDHVYEGSHLLPAVFGLEAMAEAVAYATGREALPFPLQIEDVQLTRPLVVHPERGLPIEIRAHVEERTPGKSDGQHVQAEIRCQQTGFEQVHFSARFVLEASMTPRQENAKGQGRPLPIRPAEHLYGSVLFQGPRFQRIDHVYALDSAHCILSTTQDASDETWLLGDPYHRDALLQSLQLCVVPDQCLPVHIDRWKIADPDQAERTGRFATARIEGQVGDTYIGSVSAVSAKGAPIETLEGYHARALMRRAEWPDAQALALRGSTRDAETEPGTLAGAVRAGVNGADTWDGGVFYRDVPGYGLEGQTAFFCRFPLSAQDSSSVSGSLNSASYFRWAGKLREWGGMNTPGVYRGILEMLGSNEVVSATNECETRIFKAPQRSDFIEGRYWMEYVNRGDAGNIFEWWRVPFPSGEPEMIAWTRMRISAVKTLRHGVISATNWPEFLYRFLKDMGDDANQPTRGPELDLDLGAPLFTKAPGPQPGVRLVEETFSSAQEDSNVVGNIYFANYSVWQGRVMDRFFHSLAPHLFEDRGIRGELHRAETRIGQLRDAMPFDEISVAMYLEELYERGARFSFDFFRQESGGLIKIAAGHSRVAWARVERGAEPEPLEWPPEFRDAMLASADVAAPVYRKHA